MKSQGVISLLCHQKRRQNLFKKSHRENHWKISPELHQKNSNKIPNDRNRHELTRKDLQNTHNEILRKTHLSLPQSYHRESPGKHSQKTHCDSPSNITVAPTGKVSPDAQNVGTFRYLCETHREISQRISPEKSHRTLKTWVRSDIYERSQKKTHCESHGASLTGSSKRGYVQISG